MSQRIFYCRQPSRCIAPKNGGLCRTCQPDKFARHLEHLARLRAELSADPDIMAQRTENAGQLYKYRKRNPDGSYANKPAKKQLDSVTRRAMARSRKWLKDNPP